MLSCCHGFLIPKHTLELMQIKVTRVAFWMAHFLSKTPKRQYMYSNSSKIGLLNKGRLMLGHARLRSNTTRRIKIDGKEKYYGTRHLQETQILDLQQAAKLNKIFRKDTFPLHVNTAECRHCLLIGIQPSTLLNYIQTAPQERVPPSLGTSEEDPRSLVPGNIQPPFVQSS